MANQYQEQLDILLDLIKKDSRSIELQKLRKELLKDESLLNDINKVQSADYSYDSSVVQLKKELFDNELYSRYIKLENEIHFLTLEMNQILNRLTDRKGCSK